MLQTITQTLTGGVMTGGGGPESGATSRPTTTTTNDATQTETSSGQQQPRHHSSTTPPTHHQRSSTSTNVASRPQAPSLASGAATVSLAATTSPNPPAPSSAKMSSTSPSAAAGVAATLAHTRRSPSPATMATKRSAAAVQSEGARWSLMGAMGAHEKRARSVSSPQPVAARVMGAARRSSISQTPEPATPNTAAEDRRKTDILSAATISMAKRTPSTKATMTPQTSDRTERPRYPHLEDAARRIAEERLARIGYTPEHHNSRRRFPLRSYSLTKSRSEVRAEQIDVEMQGLEGSQKKRGQDALLLMTVARRNVQDRMSAQDRQIAESRGLVSREDWTRAATEIAQRDSDARLENHGKIDMGGGMYMSQDEIDVIAARNVRPVIDDLHERQAADIEQRRAAAAAAEEKRLDKENEKRSAAFLRAQEKETEAELKSAEKLRKKELKRYLKAKESEPKTMAAPPTPPAELTPEPELTAVDPIPATYPTPGDSSPEPSLYSTPATSPTTTGPHNISLAEAVRATTPPASPPRNTPNTTPKRRISSLGLLRLRPLSPPPASPTLEEEPARATFLTKLRRNISTRRRSEPLTAVETAPPQVSSPPPQKQGNKLKRIVGLSKSPDAERGVGKGKGFDAGTNGWVAGIQKRDPVETERLRIVSGGGRRTSVSRQGQESRFTEEL